MIGTGLTSAGGTRVRSRLGGWRRAVLAPLGVLEAPLQGTWYSDHWGKGLSAEWPRPFCVMEAPSPCCERQDPQLDFDFQLCEASGWWGWGGVTDSSSCPFCLEWRGQGDPSNSVLRQLNPLPRQVWQGRQTFPLLLPGGRKSWRWGRGRCHGRQRRPAGGVTRTRRGGGKLRLQLVTVTLSGGGSREKEGAEARPDVTEVGGPAGGPSRL